MKKFFVFDVESIGLHGEAFAVAGGVYCEDGSRESEFCFSVDPSGCFGREDDRKWVSENIPTSIIEQTHRFPRNMRDAFWARWMRAKEDGAVMAADCPWPVEAKFLIDCISDHPIGRNWEGPYPFIDIASVIMASGDDPLANSDRLPDELPKHHPLGDARQSARILFEALSKCKSEVV